MKTKIITTLGILALCSASLSAAEVESAVVPAKYIDLAFQIAAWYGAVCVAFNGLAALISTVVKRTPGQSDDEAIDKLYENGLYKLIAKVFSWGDYVAEWVAKLKK
jgi:hypothetical protein